MLQIGLFVYLFLFIYFLFVFLFIVFLFIFYFLFDLNNDYFESFQYFQIYFITYGS